MSYICNITDSIGNYYLGINIPKYKIKKYLEMFKQLVGEDLYNTLTSNQLNRDSNKYHITVINVMQYQKLKLNEDELSKLHSTEIKDLVLKGIGRSMKGDNITYYIVCESNMLNEIRSSLNLDTHHFHITIGYDKKDIFKVDKSQVIVEYVTKY